MRLRVLILIVTALIAVSCDKDNPINSGSDKIIIDKIINQSDLEQVLESDNNLRIIIPSGIIEDNISIKVTKLAESPANQSSSFIIGNNIFKIVISGILKSGKDIEIRIKYDKSKVKSGSTISESVMGIIYKSNAWIATAYQLDLENEEIVLFYNLSSKSYKDYYELQSSDDIIFGDAYSTLDSGQNDNDKCDCGWVVDYTNLTKIVAAQGDLVFYVNNIGAKHGPEMQWFDATKKQLEFTKCWHEFKGIQYQHGLSVWWWQSGKMKSQSNFLKGKYNGISKEWYENGNKKRMTYWRNNEQHGADSSWYENGNLKLTEFYKDDKEEGIQIYWWENGNKMSAGNYKTGKKSGEWTFWAVNGIKVMEGTYIEGLRTGNWTEWYENGNIKNKGQYTNDKTTGIWWYYNEDGSCYYGFNYDTNENIKCP